MMVPALTLQLPCPAAFLAILNLIKLKTLNLCTFKSQLNVLPQTEG